MTRTSAEEVAILVTSEIAPTGTEPYSADWHFWRGVALRVIRASRRHEAKARKAGQVKYFIFDDASKEIISMQTK